MIIDLKENIENVNYKYIGKKAENLIRLKNASFNIPSGFVISSIYYDEIIKEYKDEIDKLIMGLNSDNIEYIKLKIYEIFNKIQIPEKIKNEIKAKVDVNKKYAVRSSGLKEDLSDFSFAGQYESFLNTEGLENIFKNIIESYKSMFSNTNLSYLINNNISYKDLKMAVIIQEMVDSDFSGIAFTINPLTGIDKEIVIEIAEGLGDKIVSGKVIPKNYIYNWYLKKWIEKEDDYLNKKILNEMIEESLSIQIHFGFPCDIEFAIKNDVLYILQARAITKINYTKITDQWTTADFKDGGVSATVCHPYMWSLYEYIWEYSFNLFLEEAVLYKTEDKLGDMFYGRPYWNLSKAKHGMSKIIGYKERDFDNEIGVEINYEGDGETTNINLISIFNIIRILLRNKKMSSYRLKNNDMFLKDLIIRYEELYKEISDYKNKDKDKNNKNKINDENIENKWMNLIYKDYFSSENKYFNQIFINMISQTIYKENILKYVDNTSYLNLLIGLQDISHLRPYNKLWDLSRNIRKNKDCTDYWKKNNSENIKEEYFTFLNNKVEDIKDKKQSRNKNKNYFNELEVFLNEFGYHSEKELDVSFPHFIEDPINIIDILKEYILLDDNKSPVLEQKKQLEKFESELNKLKEKLSKRKFNKLQKNINEMRTMLWWREEFRDVSTKYYFLIRLYTLELAEYYKKRKIINDINDIWFLKIDDIKRYINKEINNDELNNIININKKYYQSFRNYENENENEIGAIYLKKAESHNKNKRNNENTLSGVGTNIGIVQGRARIINSYSEINKINDDEILITKFTDTGWTSVFGRIKGIVTEYGGILCHAAIVSREYGIPCIVGAKDITKKIKDGSLIEINGETGEITIIKE